MLTDAEEKAAQAKIDALFNPVPLSHGEAVAISICVAGAYWFISTEFADQKSGVPALGFAAFMTGSGAFFLAQGFWRFTVQAIAVAARLLRRRGCP